ncbi:nucleotidyltransferase domain-containing protein [Rhodococcus koreensis]
MTVTSPRFAAVLTERLVQVCDPLAVRLFGSWAKNQANVHSDVDLIVLVDRTPTPRLQAEIEDALQCVPMRVDTLLWTIPQLRTALDEPLSFAGSALRSSRTLYIRDSARTTLAGIRGNKLNWEVPERT